jgi:putative transposase
MSNVIKFDIGSSVYYGEFEYIIKGYPSATEILIKKTIKPFNEKIVTINNIINNPKNIKVQKELVDLPQEKIDTSNEKYQIIEPLLKLKNRTAKDVKKVAKKHNKGVATLYRWINTFEEYGTTSALASKRENCGGKGKSRLDESVDTIINNVIEELYLNRLQYPLQDIYEKIINMCENMQLTPPTKNTVRNRISNIHPKLIAKHRKGIKVKETRGMPNKFPDVKMPLDIIQIDHTKVDVQIVEEETRKSIGRPYITVAIDVFSRMIYGFYISLEAPSYFSVGQCLLNAIMPKDDLLKKYGVEGEYPVYGLPRKIHMDNGKDFRSISLQNFCQEFRIEDIYRPVARPEFGGTVERVIGTSMKKMHTIPGSTKSNVFEKGSYDSEEEAVMTIDELEKWYLDFVINVYHKTEHSSLGMTPEEKFYQGLYGVREEKNIPFLPNVPANTLKLRMSLLPEIKRSVQKNGITIDYITYFSETLRKWIIPSQYKKLKPDLNNQVICRRDPRDISKIYVLDQDTNEYITVPYADIRKPKMNLDELREAISEAKRQVTGRELEPHDIFEAKEKLREQIEKAKREKKSTKRRRSSTKHQNKTLSYEKEQIDYKENQLKINNYQTLSKSDIENDEDGYDIYPIG